MYAGIAPIGGLQVGRGGAGNECGARVLLGRLPPHERMIVTAGPYQFGMRSLFNNPAACEDENAIAADDARQSMREDEGGAAHHQAIERVLDHRFVFGIDRGQRLVEHQNRRVAKERPGDGDALALPAGELDAALAHHRPVALRQLADERVRVGRPRGGLEFGLRGVVFAEPQIVLDGAVEEVRVLIHDGEYRMQGLERHRGNVDAVDTDAALGRIVESEEQSHDARLAGSAGANDADSFAGRNVELKMIVHVLFRRRIRERDVVELNIRLDRTARRAVIGDKRVRVEHAVQSLRGRLSQHARM